MRYPISSTFLCRYNCGLHWHVGFMLCVVRKPDVDELDIDICRAYQELCIAHEKNHYLSLDLTNVIGAATVGECNDLFIGVFKDGVKLVNIQFFGREEFHELVVNPGVLGFTTHF